MKAQSFWSDLNWDMRNLLLGGSTVLVAYLVLVPLFFLVYGSFFSPSAKGIPGAGELTLRNYTVVYSDPDLYGMIWNSVYYALGASVLAVIIAVTLAWLVERTNVPGKQVFYALILGPLIIPGMLHTIAWVFLLSPKIGLINVIFVKWLGFSSPPFDVYGMYGMMWVEGLHLSPLAFLLVAAAFNSLDPSLEEAARVSGAKPLTVFYQITVRVTSPALYASFLVMFIRTLESFEVPAVLGLSKRIYVFTSRIYMALHSYPIDYGVAGALSVMVLVITGIGVLLYTRMLSQGDRFSTVTGKGFRPAVTDLRGWRWPAAALLTLYFVLVFALPLFILSWASVIPYFATPSMKMLQQFTWHNYDFVLDYPLIGRAFRNSVTLALGAATVTTLITAGLSWMVVKTRLKGRWLVDALASLPLAIPSLVLGVALIWLYLRLPISLYGTLWLMLIAYVTKYLPYGMRYSTAAMVQIHKELEEVAQISGASWFTVFRRILLPLLLPGMAAGWVYIVTVAFRELGASIMLYSSGSEVLSVLLYDMWNGGYATQVAALGVLMIVAILILNYGSQALRRRYGLRV